MATSSTASRLDLARHLRSDLAAGRFALPLAGQEEAEAIRVDLIGQLDTHIIPRLSAIYAPAIVAVVGASGVGKSAIINTIAGQSVTADGVLRPTTRAPLVVLNPEDRDTAEPKIAGNPVPVVLNSAVPTGLALLDTPGIDTTQSDLPRLAYGADMWLCVTTANRYGDANLWALAAAAARRSTQVAMVLNRVPQAALAQVRADTLSLMERNGLGEAPLFILPDLGPHTGALPQELIVDLLVWLGMLAGPDHARGMVLRSLFSAFVSMHQRMQVLVQAAAQQVEGYRDLEEYLGARRDGLIDMCMQGRCPPQLLQRLHTRLEACLGPGGALEAVSTGRVSRRRRRAFAASAAPVWAQVTTDVTLAAAGLIRSGYCATRAALSDALHTDQAPALARLAAGDDGADQEAVRLAALREAEAWLADVRYDVEDDWPTDEVRGFVRDAGPGGAVALVAAAGLGSSLAEGVVQRMAPDAGARLVEQAVVALGRARRAAARACVDGAWIGQGNADGAEAWRASLQLRTDELGDELR